MIRFYFTLAILLLLTSAASATAGDDIWLLVDTQTLTLQVKKGYQTVDVFNNIAIGQSGAGFKQRRGDRVTPLGIYHIAWINNKSPFRRFFGFDYPSKENAHDALMKGLIDLRDYQRILVAHQQGKTPPQNTPLGGQLGIHGLGRADPLIHQMTNWTRGCIALTNEQIDRLSSWIGKDTVVVTK
jgi:murein L,D-transpeptidase YafK